jgi:hypothetical protein
MTSPSGPEPLAPFHQRAAGALPLVDYKQDGIFKSRLAIANEDGRDAHRNLCNQCNLWILAFSLTREEILGVSQLVTSSKIKPMKLETRLTKHDDQIQAIREAIRQLMTPPASKSKEIGFRSKQRKK